MSPYDVALDLLLREERRPPAPATGGPVLVAAAAALGAGEPKRAAAALAAAPLTGDDARIATALVHVAVTLDHNWFPGGGGAVLTGSPPAPPGPPGTPRDPTAALLTTVAHRLVVAAPAWRSIADNARRSGSPVAGFGLVEATGLLTELVDAGRRRALGPTALVLADLHLRSRSGQHAEILRLARMFYAGDAIGMACCDLTELDALLPGGRAELLGEDLDGLPAALPAADPDLAGRYRQLAGRFADAGSDRGVAAVALREAQLAAGAADGDGARAHLDRARAGGDPASAHLAVVHAALLDIELGRPVDAGTVTGPLVEWATTVGSTSWARGLARLCDSRAERLRDTDLPRSQRARALGELLADGIGAELESALARREKAAAYGAANYRRAAVRLLLGELADARVAAGGRAPGTAVGWAGLVEQAVAAHRDAAAARDAELLTAVAESLRRLLDDAPTAGGHPDGVEEIRRLLAETLRESDVLTPLYRGCAARDAGDPETAATAFAAALDAICRPGSPVVLTVAVLAPLRRSPEAVVVAERAWRSGTLAAELAAPLFLRLGRPDLAEQAAAALPAEDGRSWDRPALAAETALGLGRPDPAVAEVAVVRFERHLAGLSRDILRTMGLDSPAVAGLYMTAVRSHAALARPKADDEHLDRAFALSDRSRGMTLADLVDSHRDAATETAAAAVRSWQRAGAELGRTVEELAATAPEPSAARSRMRRAERALDHAEEALVAAAPRLYHGRRRRPAEVSVAEVQARLAAGTVLVQYHAYDDRIVFFVLTADSADVRVTAAGTAELTGDARRFHRLVADPASTPPDRQRLGAALATTLLEPVAAELDAHDRLIVVPFGGGLSVLPFHALPWGDGELGSGSRVVSYLPAASVLLNRFDRAPATGPPLVVGDPDYAAGGLRPLPGTGVEGRAVAALHGVEPLTGAAVRRGEVLDRLAGAPLVHLATHGLLREAAPYSSYLALAGTDRLTVPDLMGLGPRLDLAVLSACDSGRGRATAAGDVVGLTRALLGSGVRGLVVSLWPVDDVLACLTMVGFHERTVAGSPPVTALAEATARLRTMREGEAARRYAELGGHPAAARRTVRSARDLGPAHPGPAIGDPAHPSAWAPFVYVGAP